MGEQEAKLRIVEGLKRRRVLEKRMDSTAAEISKYASKLSTEKAVFGSDDAQKEEVSKRIQSNLDLAEEILKLTRRIELTNRATKVTINSQTRPIADWLTIKRQLGPRISATYTALDTRTTERRRGDLRMSSGVDAPSVQVERMYDEAEKNKKLREWEDTLAAIDGRLERVNADTELLD